jgi:hypothetical protein
MHDFNADGLIDLLVGNDYGDFVLFLNKGKEQKQLQVTEMVDNSIDQQSGSLMVEDVEGRIEVDVDQEAVQDENTEFDAAGIVLIEDQPEKVKADPIFVPVRTPLVRNERISRSVPTFGDLDQDGDLDLLIGSASGKIYYYENDGTDTQWSFRLVNEDFMPDRDRRNAAPLLYDLDQDGDLDLIVGSQTGKIYFYSNQGTTEETNFVPDANGFSNLWIGQNSKPAAADLDGDGLLDLLVGSFNGRLTYIHNESSHFSIARRDYQKIDVDLGSTPFFADLNNSDQLDLIIGSDSGKILFLRNEKVDLMGLWAPLPKINPDLSFPKSSSPVAHDLDADGDLDLITGSEAGPVYYYRNDAIVREIEPDTETQPSSRF